MELSTLANQSTGSSDSDYGTGTSDDSFQEPVAVTRACCSRRCTMFAGGLLIGQTLFYAGVLLSAQSSTRGTSAMIACGGAISLGYLVYGFYKLATGPSQQQDLPV